MALLLVGIGPVPESGQIWIPEQDLDWLQTFHDEAVMFTGADKEKNDIISTLSYAAVEVERNAANEGADAAFVFPSTGMQRY